MKKKMYEKPSTKVFELKKQTLLYSSSVNATMDDTWTEEEI